MDVYKGLGCGAYVCLRVKFGEKFGGSEYWEWDEVVRNKE